MTATEGLRARPTSRQDAAKRVVRRRHRRSRSCSTPPATVHAIGDTCTHGDISLSEGFVEDDTLECWAHGSKFELTTGKPLSLPAYEPVPVFAVEIIDGDVYIDPTPRR